MRPTGWLASYWLIGPGSAGLAEGCRCALPLQASAGAYRGRRPPTACFISLCIANCKSILLLTELSVMHQSSRLKMRSPTGSHSVHYAQSLTHCQLNQRLSFFNSLRRLPLFHLLLGNSFNNFYSVCSLKYTHFNRNTVFFLNSMFTNVAVTCGKCHWCGLRQSVLGQDRSETKKSVLVLVRVVKHGLFMLVVIMILKDTETFQVLFVVSLFCARNITTVEINSGVQLLKS